jgi:hypothetical protein
VKSNACAAISSTKLCEVPPGNRRSDNIKTSTCRRRTSSVPWAPETNRQKADQGRANYGITYLTPCVHPAVGVSGHGTWENESSVQQARVRLVTEISHCHRYWGGLDPRAGSTRNDSGRHSGNKPGVVDLTFSRCSRGTSLRIATRRPSSQLDRRRPNDHELKSKIKKTFDGR